jgi:hypothetical protein
VQAVTLCREADVRLSPTFVPFTPWTTVAGYVDLLDQLRALELEEDVAPIQLAIRLLVTADSALLELDEIHGVVDVFDPDSLTYPWRHANPAVDELQTAIMRLVSSLSAAPRRDAFEAIDAVAREAAQILPPEGGSHRNGDVASAFLGRRSLGEGGRRKETTVPHMTEAWYCCAEPASAEAPAGRPGPDIAGSV